jgi:hypothetical protein
MMRGTVALLATLFASGAISLVGGCGSVAGPPAGEAPDAESSYDSGPTFVTDASNGDDSDTDAGAGTVLSNAHIVPANAVLTVQGGQTASLAYKVMGQLDGAPEVDVTDRFVFYVPDNYLVGGFPTTGAPLFTTRLPSAATDPPQRGGTLTVQAQAANPGAQLVTVTTSLTVQLLSEIDVNASTAGDAGAGDAGTGDAGLAPLPGNPASLFASAPADPTRAPILEYPNNGAMLPPNLRLLDVHWLPGSASNTLFQVSFQSPSTEITYYTRCGTLGGLIVAGGCGFQLDETGYEYLAQSNAGGGPVQVTVAGTDDSGTGMGTSQSFGVQFAQQPVNGGVYYWDVTHTQIMRFDFGGTASTPEVFLAPGQYGTSGTCIGCHALSADGTKMAASAGGQGDGYLVYIDGVAAPTTPLTANEDTANRIQFASFDPFGDLFVAVYGDGAPSQNPSLTPNNLFFHDGTTGLLLPGATKALSFQPDHPAWSPDGTMIAMTHVGSANTSQMEYLGGIDVATFGSGAVGDAGVTLLNDAAVPAVDGGTGQGDGGAAAPLPSTLGDPVVVIPNSVVGSATAGIPAVNSYNPSFAPDSTFLVFTQTTCPASVARTALCDSDISSNLSATTWAVKPAAGAAPIHLDRAGTPGVADGPVTSVLDTFPRSTPFQTAQGSGRLFWFTVASVRQPGLRHKDFRAPDEGSGQDQQQLWMFAVDPDKIASGVDGSYPAFFLPFQDPTTSNHIAQWTQQIVSSNPPAPPAPTPPPPPPPAPPPVPTAR